MNIFSNFSFVHLDSGYQLTSFLLQHFFNAYWSFINIIEGVLYSLPQRSYNLNWQFRRIISLFQELEHSKISDLLKVTWNVQKTSTSSFHCPAEIHGASYPSLWEHWHLSCLALLPSCLRCGHGQWLGMGVAGQLCFSSHCSLLTVVVIHGACFYGAN